MPWIGAVDVLVGMAVLFAPRRLPLLYMVGWATWTALLRPLAGEPVFETLERAGNVGVPLAFLVLAGWPRPRSWQGLVGSDAAARRTKHLARVSVCSNGRPSALMGHGASGPHRKAI